MLIAVMVAFLRQCYKKRQHRRRLRRGLNHTGVHYDPNDKLQQANYYKENTINGRKVGVGYSPVRKFSSPGFIAIYSPEKKGYSVYDEYDSDTCWHNKEDDMKHQQDYAKGAETYVNHNAHHPRNYQRACNHYENRESLARERQMMMTSPNLRHSPKNRIRNSPSGSLMQVKKSQYISCPILPTPPESDPEADINYVVGATTQPPAGCRDRMVMTHRNATFNPNSTRVNTQSKSAVV